MRRSFQFQKGIIVPNAQHPSKSLKCWVMGMWSGAEKEHNIDQGSISRLATRDPCCTRPDMPLLEAMDAEIIAISEGNHCSQGPTPL